MCRKVILFRALLVLLLFHVSVVCFRRCQAQIVSLGGFLLVWLIRSGFFLCVCFEYVIVSSAIFLSMYSSRVSLVIVRVLFMRVSLVGSFDNRSAIVYLSVFFLVWVLQVGIFVSIECSSSSSLMRLSSRAISRSVAVLCLMQL